MNKLSLILSFLALISVLNVKGQSLLLTVKQQNEDFTIFKGGLKEGHSGIYYFISKTAFDNKCDSIQKTFKEGTTIEDYYLKLRFLSFSLRHGHTGISIGTNGNINYKMAVLDSTKLYLPYEFLIINKQLIIKEDCSKEQLIPKYSIVKSINNRSSKDLIKNMLPYMPADGINQTYKYYSLSNYFYFHYLFNLFYSDKRGVKLEIENNKTHFYTELLKPKSIDSIYFIKNKKSISNYDKQLEYNPNIVKQTAYLRIGSFYKGLIENFGQKYETFLDSTFADIKAKNIQNLILDLRNNEGGGDGYDFLLLSYLIDKNILPDKVTVPGRQFQYLKYAVGLSDDFKAFVENPNNFLQDDTTLALKEEYTGQIIKPKSDNYFDGKIVVLINGGTFSASTNCLKRLYSFRQSNNRNIMFIGEENGGDIYSNTECAGQGYGIKLPNSSVTVYVPLLCFGELKMDYPKKRLPDYEIFNTISDLKTNKDRVLNFALILFTQK